MAEQSSTVAFFRALIMLLCLVAVVLAACCGSSFPTVLKAIQSGRMPTLADFRPVPPQSELGVETARFLQPPPATQARANDLSNGLVGNSPGQLAAIPSANRWPANSAGHSAASADNIMLAGYNAPIAAPKDASSGSSTHFPQNDTAGTRQNPVKSQAGQNFDSLPNDLREPPSQVENAGTAPPVGASASDGRSADAPSGDKFKYVQDRLRQLGATYYLLEAWGDQKREFRFYCKMAIGGNPQFTKPFWSVDGDPLKAMTQVLQQVEGWRGAL